MKKIIILLTILLCIIIIVLIAIGSSLDYKALENNNTSTEEFEKILKEVENVDAFYLVKDCVEKYYLHCIMALDAENYCNNAFDVTDISKEEIQAFEKQNARILNNLLYQELKNEKKITSDNIKQKLNKVEMCVVNITNIYVSEQSDNINVFLVKGKLKGEITQSITDFQVMVKTDSTNRTFCIIPQEYLEEKYTNIDIGMDLEINVQEKIEPNNDNKYEISSITEETYVKNLFAKLKKEIQHFPELVYNRLDEEYKNKKYETFDKFQELINNNMQKYLSMRIDSYKKTTTDEYTEYVCIDKNGDYYIFRESAIMDYSLILDVYTVDLAEVAKKYDSSGNKVKVILNIGKLIEATKNEDYKYVYDKLDDTFKNNNFKTLQDFENFIKGKFNPEEDGIEYKSYEEITNIHVYNIEVTDTSENKTIKAKVVMDLKDNRDFVFSFSTEN